MTSILRRIAVIATTLILVVVLASASGANPGITFAAPNGFNLTIDSHATYNGVVVPSSTWDLKDLVPVVDKFFNISNVLPGDYGFTTVSLHVNKPAWMCLAFSNLESLENGEIEPEDPVDPSTPAGKGELAEGTEFFAWHDDGDNTFEVGEQPIFGTGLQSAAIVLASTTYALADAGTNTPIPAGVTRHVGIAWCAGNLSVNLVTAAVSCDGSALGNAAQTDSFSVDMGLQTAVAADQPNFLCSLGGEPATTTPGLGEQIGLTVKCKTIATWGWPLPKYKTECPAGFSAQAGTQQPVQAPPVGSRTPRTR